MDLIDVVRNFLRRGASTQEAPESYCPNCWGRQEYEGRFLESVQQEKIDLNNVEAKRGWIQAYAAKYFDGIRLRGGTCPACQSP